MPQSTNPSLSDPLPRTSEYPITKMSAGATIAVDSVRPSVEDAEHPIPSQPDHPNNYASAAAAIPTSTQTLQTSPPPKLLTRLTRVPRATLIRLSAIILSILALIIVSIRHAKSLDYEVYDDGASDAMIFLLWVCSAPLIVCESSLILIPYLRVHRRRFPFRAATATPRTKPQLHPAVTLSISLCVFGATFSLSIVALLLGYYALTDPMLCIPWVLVLCAVVLELGLVVSACKDVHRLRKEQKTKRGSLRGCVTVVGGEGQENIGGDQGLRGWVEMTDTEQGSGGVGGVEDGRRSGGVGGGLGGVGKGL